MEQTEKRLKLEEKPISIHISELLDFPNEIICLILEFLPVKDLIHNITPLCRRVNKLVFALEKWHRMRFSFDGNICGNYSSVDGWLNWIQKCEKLQRIILKVIPSYNIQPSYLNNFDKITHLHIYSNNSMSFPINAFISLSNLRLRNVLPEGVLSTKITEVSLLYFFELDDKQMEILVHHCERLLSNSQMESFSFSILHPRNKKVKINVPITMPKLDTLLVQGIDFRCKTVWNLPNLGFLGLVKCNVDTNCVDEFSFPKLTELKLRCKNSIQEKFLSIPQNLRWIHIAESSINGKSKIFGNKTEYICALEITSDINELCLLAPNLMYVNLNCVEFSTLDVIVEKLLKLETLRIDNLSHTVNEYFYRRVNHLSEIGKVDYRHIKKHFIDSSIPWTNLSRIEINRFPDTMVENGEIDGMILEYEKELLEKKNIRVRICY
jgi:hypothetical protein